MHVQLHVSMLVAFPMKPQDPHLRSLIIALLIVKPSCHHHHAIKYTRLEKYAGAMPHAHFCSVIQSITSIQLSSQIGRIQKLLSEQTQQN
jgi:hypothetical protein